MIVCIYCQYPRNPETATNCVKCRAPLSQRGATLTEDEYQNQQAVASGDARRRTMADGVPSTSGFPPPTAENELPANPWRNSGGYEQPADPTPVSYARSSGPGTPGQRRQTVYGGFPIAEPIAGAPAASPAAQAPVMPGISGVRKIVGVLITYSWDEQGQIFPVLEGRNLIGKDPAQCNICIRQDATLSDVNSSIAYRSQFVIRDKDSMCGTFVDGAFVEAEPIPLRNYAKIRTGSTNWTFVAIQPPATADPAASDT